MRKVRCRGKRRFRSHQEAVRSLHRIANRSTRDRQPVRTYECPLCKGWHLTSQAESRGMSSAAERGRQRAIQECANVVPPTVIDVTLDRGGMAERLHIAWCLLCQGPAARCTCDNATAAEALIEDPVDVATDVASVIAATRGQLDTFTAAGLAMVDVPTGERL